MRFRIIIWFKGTVATLVATGFASSALLAQSGTSAISGMASDATGAYLPGAEVHLVNEDTGLALDTSTNEEGRYRFLSLVPGTYLLNRADFNIPGFTLGAADFGVISSARPARTVQLGG